MDPIRKLPAVKDRVESGPVQFGDDWPGLFIRGDNAMAFRMAIASVLMRQNSAMAEAQLRVLAELFESCQIVATPNIRIKK